MNKEKRRSSNFHLGRLVVGARAKQLRRFVAHIHGVHELLVTFELLHALAAHHVPHTNRLVGRARHDLTFVPSSVD